MGKLQKIEVSSHPNEIHKVLQFIERICDEKDIYNSYYGNIVTSITEAFNNAIEHGNNFSDDKSVTISFETKNDGLTFCVEDQGNGFNPLNITNPTDPNFDAESGRGIFVMGLLSDNMLFLENGAKVCFKFLISNINKETSDKRIEKLHAFLGKKVNQTIKNI